MFHLSGNAGEYDLIEAATESHRRTNNCFTLQHGGFRNRSAD